MVLLIACGPTIVCFFVFFFFFTIDAIDILTLMSVKKICVNEDKSGKLAWQPLEKNRFRIRMNFYRNRHEQGKRFVS